MTSEPFYIDNKLRHNAVYKQKSAHNQYRDKQPLQVQQRLHGFNRCACRHANPNPDIRAYRRQQQRQLYRIRFQFVLQEVFQ